MDITNDAQLYSIFVPIIQDGVKYTMEMALKLYRQYIESMIYGAGDPEEYDRTYEFLESWETEVQENFFGAKGVLGQNTDFMTFMPDIFRHGSNISGDARAYLATLLFEGLGTPGLFGEGWYSYERNAYDEFIQDIEKNDRLITWFRNYLKKHKLYIIKN